MFEEKKTVIDGKFQVTENLFHYYPMSILDSYINWQTLFIKNDIFILIRDKYYRLPIVLRNNVTLSKKREPNLKSGGETTIREEIR